MSLSFNCKLCGIHMKNDIYDIDKICWRCENCIDVGCAKYCLYFSTVNNCIIDEWIWIRYQYYFNYRHKEKLAYLQKNHPGGELIRTFQIDELTPELAIKWRDKLLTYQVFK